jgi:hypothetical protein
MHFSNRSVIIYQNVDTISKLPDDMKTVWTVSHFWFRTLAHSPEDYKVPG